LKKQAKKIQKKKDGLDMAEEKIMTVAEVASLLRCSKPQVINLATQGKIPSFNIGVGGNRILRFERSKIEDLFNGEKIDHPILSGKKTC